MRINYIGNVCNYAFWWAKLARKSLLADTKAFIDIDHSTFSKNVPWWDDPTIDKHNPPDWIYLVPRVRIPGGLLGGEKTRSVNRLLRKCDLIHSFGVAASIWARRSKIPYVYQSYGDINTLISNRRIFTPKKLLRYIILRRALYGAKNIIISQLLDFKAVSFLGLESKLVVLPIIYDCETISPENVENNSHLIKKFKDWDLIFFAPARHIRLKGNDKIIHCFAKFLRDRRERALLLFTEFGPDLVHSKRLITNLGIHENVKWIPRQTKQGLMQFMTLPRLSVIDQFGESSLPASFGGVGRDALALEAVLITHVTMDGIKRLHGTEPPILWTDHSEESIYNRMVEFAQMSEHERQIVGQRGRKWMIAEHHYETLLPRYFELYKETLHNSA